MKVQLRMTKQAPTNSLNDQIYNKVITEESSNKGSQVNESEPNNSDEVNDDEIDKCSDNTSPDSNNREPSEKSGIDGQDILDEPE